MTTITMFIDCLARELQTVLVGLGTCVTLQRPPLRAAMRLPMTGAGIES